MGDLPPRMHPGVRAAGDRERDRRFPRSAFPPQDGAKCSFQRLLDGAPARLARPAGEAGAFVAEVEAETDEPAVRDGDGGLDGLGVGGQRAPSAGTVSPADSAW